MLACTEDSAHDREHIYRVLHLALEIAATEPGCDREVLAAACLLHDIGRPAQFADSRVDHADAGAVQAACFLRENGFSPAFAGRVGDCIRTHRFRSSAPPESLEAKILFDADKIDSSGAMGVARTLLYQGQMGQPLYTLRPDGHISDGQGEEAPSFFASTAASWRGSATGSTPRAGGPWPPSAAPLPPPFTGTCWPRHAPRATARGFPLLSGKGLESAVKGPLGPVADGCVGGVAANFSAFPNSLFCPRPRLLANIGAAKHGYTPMKGASCARVLLWRAGEVPMALLHAPYFGPTGHPGAGGPHPQDSTQSKTAPQTKRRRRPICRAAASLPLLRFREMTTRG